MLIFNSDETGISVVHKPGKVVAELGRHNVYSLTSAERGKTHTILSCVSASGYVLPPMMIYPRKKAVPDKLKEGAVPGTLLVVRVAGLTQNSIWNGSTFSYNTFPQSDPCYCFRMGMHPTF